MSQDESIEVSDVTIPEGAKKDSNGVVKWKPVIAAKKKMQWRLEYTLEYPNELIERHRNDPASPAPAKQRMLMDDIDSLENML